MDIRPLCSYSQTWVTIPNHQQEKVPMNCPEQLTRLRTQSASSVNGPCPVDKFDPERDRQEGEDPRWPQAGYRVCSSVTSMHEIENCLYLMAMTLLGVTCHNARAFGNTFRHHSRNFRIDAYHNKTLG